MASSPLDDASGVVSVEIITDGKANMVAVSQILELTVTKQFNRISKAKIRFSDGDMPKGDFPLSSGNDFVPGNDIEIRAGYANRVKTIFKGIVVRHGISIGGNNQAELDVECHDKAMKLTVGRKNRQFMDEKDSGVIKTILNDVGLKADVDATTFTHPQILQYDATDWDFMLARAEFNGLLVAAVDNEVSVTWPKASGGAELSVTYGVDIIEFDAAIDPRMQFDAVEAVGWDNTQQGVNSAKATPTNVGEQGNLTAKKLASVVDLEAFRLQSIALAKPDELKIWATARQRRSALSRIRGQVKFSGSALPKLGDPIEINGLGERFSGKPMITGVTHRIAEGGWTTDVSFGLDDGDVASRFPVSSLPASGVAPAVQGLQIGQVVALADDPLKDYRIKVNLPWLDQKGTELWARLATNGYASEGFGAVVLPEIGDEVVVGFFNEDPAYPVVLGSLYSSKRKPPYEFQDENNIKAMLTRSGILIELDDDKRIVTVKTPAENQIVIDDEAKSITLKDQHSNRIEMQSSGIAIESAADIQIKAAGKIDISATSDLSAEGANVTCQAKMALSAKGNASAELSASGQTTVKGAMVMIN